MRRAALIGCLALLLAPAAGRSLATDPVEQALATAARAHGFDLSSVAAVREPPLRGVPFANALSILVPAIETAARLRQQALARVTDTEIATARAISEAVTLGSDVAPDDIARASAVIARIDMQAMLRGAAILSDAVERALPHLRTGGPEAKTCSPGGALCIGTSGPDVWEQDVQILLDPGGDDVYLNNAGGVLYQPGFESTGGCAFGGGTTGRARPNLACTSAPSTVCSYDTLNRASGREDLPVVGVPGHDDPDAPSGGQGTDGSCGSDRRRQAAIDAALAVGDDADARGIALLVDAGGSDTYTVPWTHDDPLFDLIEDCFPGESDKVNTNRDLFQGSALGGIGLLWDDGAGNDVYRGRLNAQGTGHVGGVGMLVTSGSGDATFWADRLAQGNGIGGGVGVLVNAKDGEHTYLLDPPVVYRNEFGPSGRACAQEGRAGQGQGGFGGVGVLWNANAGDAVYRSVSHLVGEAHPFPPIVEDGAPALVGGGDAQGSGESFPIVDTPGGIVAGVGLLVDDTDGDASVCPPRAPGVASAGMLTGSTTSTGIDLTSMGTLDRACGTFNLPAELDPVGDLGTALQRVLAGAVGVRVVL
jgi:hypothetical protein